MSLDYVAVFEALAAAVRAGVSGPLQKQPFKAFSAMPDSPARPCWSVADMEIEDIQQTFRGMEKVTIHSYVFVDRSGEPSASQRALARYIAPDGSYSVRAAISAQANTAAGGRGLVTVACPAGLVAGLRIIKVQGWREYQFGPAEVRAYGATIDISVWG